MRALLPPDAPTDPYLAYRLPDRGAPWLRVNMVTSLDGHVVDTEGVSGGLGREGDDLVFGALRALADAVMVGAGTIRAEGYGPLRVRRAHQEARSLDGRDDPPRLVVVSRSLALDPEHPMFAEAVTPTIVVTTADADAARVADVQAAGGVLVQVGPGEVDLPAALTVLRREHGLAQILCEGGPTLNADLLAAGLVDEICVTVPPLLAGGEDPRRLVTGLAAPVSLRLDQLLEHRGELLARYRVLG